MRFIWPTPFQTQKDIQGRLRVGSKERLTFFGQVQLNPVHSSHQAINVRANFSHQLEVSRPHFFIIYYYHYYSLSPTVWICPYTGGMVIAVISLISYASSTSDTVQPWPSIGGPWAASSPPASYLWPLNCYSFTMCFGWVSTCIPGLVFMPTIHRQLGHSLLWARILIFTFVFGAVCILRPVGWRVPSSLLKEKWTVNIGNSRRMVWKICIHSPSNQHKTHVLNMPVACGLTDLNTWTFESLKKIFVAF